MVKIAQSPTRLDSNSDVRELASGRLPASPSTPSSGGPTTEAQSTERAILTWHAEHRASVRETIRRTLYNSSLVDDVEQSFWLRVHQIAGEYDPAKGRVSAWLNRVARNLSVDANRSEERLHRLHTSADLRHAKETQSTGSTNPLTIVGDRELHKLRKVVVSDALATLSPPHRNAVELSDLRGVGPKHLPTTLHVPPGTAKSQRHRGWAALRDYLLRED